MRIAHVINNMQGGGAEKLLSLLLPLFNTGHSSADLIVLNSIDATFLEICRHQNINIIILSDDSSPYSPAHIIRLKRLLNKYDIVHSHLFPTQYWVAFAWLLSRRHARLVTTEHSTVNTRMNNFIFKPIERYVYSKYHKIIYVSDAAGTRLKNWLGFKRSDQFEMIHNGIDLTHMRAACGYAPEKIDGSLNDTHKLIIMVARFDDAKDHKTVIHAIRELPLRFKLILLGVGPLMKDCINYVSDQKLNDRVIFLGFRTDVAELIKSSFISVISSFWEGFGLVAVESMAAGIPVIASDVSGLRDVVQGAGCLFKQGDEAALVREILDLEADEGKLARIIEMQNKRAEKYNIDVTARAYLRIYQPILQNG